MDTSGNVNQITPDQWEILDQQVQETLSKVFGELEADKRHRDLPELTTPDQIIKRIELVTSLYTYWTGMQERLASQFALMNYSRNLIKAEMRHEMDVQKASSENAGRMAMSNYSWGEREAFCRLNISDYRALEHADTCCEALQNIMTAVAHRARILSTLRTAAVETANLMRLQARLSDLDGIR